MGNISINDRVARSSRPYRDERGSKNVRALFPHFAGILRDSLSFLSFEYRPIKSIPKSLPYQGFAHKKYPRGGVGGMS
jgi:hypothetical protein